MKLVEIAQGLLLVTTLGLTYVAYREGIEYRIEMTRECASLEVRLRDISLRLQPPLMPEETTYFEINRQKVETRYKSKCLNYDGTRLFTQ